MSAREKNLEPRRTSRSQHPKRFVVFLMFGIVGVSALSAVLWINRNDNAAPITPSRSISSSRRYEPTDKWLKRASDISTKFHELSTPCREGANGAMRKAHFFAATHDSTLLRFHTAEHDMRNMSTGTWVDDRAWVCLAELFWGEFHR